MGAISPPLTHSRQPYRAWIGSWLAAAGAFTAGLALSRLLYEGLFPAWNWIGRPIPALGLGMIVAGLGALAVVLSQRGDEAVVSPAQFGAAFLPLLLNLVWLVDPTVDPARSRFLFGASLWLVTILGVYFSTGDRDRRWRWLGPLFVSAGLVPVYLLTMSHAVGAADTFEFQVVAPQLGIAHPTGYPLYLLLGKLFSLLPVGTVAWRLNLASAVSAVMAAAVVFRLGLELVQRPLPALAGAVVLGLVPIYWSEAIIAEVYTLHALIVAVALWLMLDLAGFRKPARSGGDRKTMVTLAFVLGLGLANHLTTVFLLPPAAAAIGLALYRDLTGSRRSSISRRRSLALLLLQLAIAFAVPLLLYAYLPLRWAAVNGEAMGLGRFIEWVAGGRFQGALRWGAWLRDPARRQIVGRLILDAWGWAYLTLAAVGLVWLFARQWRAALVLSLTAAGFIFYALNYYVPDLAVFLIPAHVVIAVCVAAGFGAILETGLFRKNPAAMILTSLLFVVVMLPALMAAGDRWSFVDQSGRDGGEPWGRAVLGRPLARGAAVLADSEKIAPLYYLQQAEGLRPDLDIMVLPDEAAYRAEVDARLAAGEVVYLARYLPGLEGIYHLRSAGPLVEVSRESLTGLPADVIPADQAAGPMRLLGYRLEPASAAESGSTAITLFWTLDRPLREGEPSPVIYLRWAGGEPVVVGMHPAGDTYPVNAWEVGEIVPDYHLLPLPDAQQGTGEQGIEVAVAPRFTPAAELDWLPVAAVAAKSRPGPVGEPRRVAFDRFALDGIDFPATARPGVALPLRYSGNGVGQNLTFLLVPPHAVSSLIIPTGRVPVSPAIVRGSKAFAAEVEPAAETGPHVLIAYTTGDNGAICGWLARPTTGCVVAEIDIRGAALPEGATNFDDKIALLDVEVDADALAPGGQLPVTITWQGLAEMSEDYTVFVQVLNSADRIVGQVDSWPVQGTRPTSTWRPGEVVADPYVVQLASDLPPGDYRVIAGLYLLATGQRLPVIDGEGKARDDKVETKVVID